MIRDAQIRDAQPGRCRELASDTQSERDDESYWQDMSHLFSRTDSHVPRPSEEWTEHDLSRGLSVSGYARI